MFTKHYFSIITNKDIECAYRRCLEEFVTKVVSEFSLECVVLFGGLVRDGKPISQWSDLDLILVFKSLLTRNAQTLSFISYGLKKKYSIRLDITQVSLDELTETYFKDNIFNSELINALSMRDGVSTILYGTLPRFEVPQQQEKLAALFYVNNTVNQFRRYLIENVYEELSESHFRITIARVIRWTFSIIRASLRLFNIYSHPYEYSLPFVKNLFPDENVTVLEKLLLIRNDFDKVIVDYTIFAETEAFIENFYKLVQREMSKENVF